MRLVFLLFLSLSVSAQKLHHQAISSLGLSNHASNGLSVKQSVGQQSVIGNSKANNLFLGQGFLQGKFSNYKPQQNISVIETSVYPNPFFEKINFQFSNIINGLISISIYDISGKLIYGNEVSFASTASVITTGLKLHFDTSNTSSYPGSGNTLTDISGNGNNGTLVNNSSFTSSVAGGVLSFNGSNQYISTTYTPSSTCTISIWFYNNLNYTDWNRGIFSTFSSGTYNGFYMGTSNIGSYQPSLNFWYNGNSALNSISSVLVTNTWYNITVTSGSGTIKIYLNGILKNTISGSTNHADVLNIGRTRFDNNYWSGYIGNTMVYNSVLSASDVMTNFNAQKSRFGY